MQDIFLILVYLLGRQRGKVNQIRVHRNHSLWKCLLLLLLLVWTWLLLKFHCSTFPCLSFGANIFLMSWHITLLSLMVNCSMNVNVWHTVSLQQGFINWSLSGLFSYLSLYEPAGWWRPCPLEELSHTAICIFDFVECRAWGALPAWGLLPVLCGCIYVLWSISSTWLSQETLKQTADTGQGYLKMRTGYLVRSSVLTLPFTGVCQNEAEYFIMQSLMGNEA